MRAVKPGDEILFAGPLKAEGGAHRVGTSNFQCTWQFGDHIMCQVSVDLTGRGQLTAAATTAGSANDVTFAVTGGTGNFQPARGQMHLHDLGRSIRLTVQLVH